MNTHIKTFVRTFIVVITSVLVGATLAFGSAVDVISPPFGAKLCKGKTYTVTWVSQHSGPVKVVLLRHGVAVDVLADQKDASEAKSSIAWTPSGLPAGFGYSIKVRFKGQSALGVSNLFELKDCRAEGQVRVGVGPYQLIDR